MVLAGLVTGTLTRRARRGGTARRGAGRPGDVPRDREAAPGQVATGGLAGPPAVAQPASAQPASAPPASAQSPPAPPAPVAAPPPAEREVPPPSQGRLVRLRGRLARSQTSLGRGLLTVLSRDRLGEGDWEEVEETLLAADMGVGPAQEVVSALRERVRVLGVRSPDQLRALLRDELLAQVGTSLQRDLDVAPRDGLPAVVLLVGVNGTGKTTTCGKLARVLVGDGRQVVLGAADTFRAAAADQLQTWAERVGATTVRGAQGADPASVAYDAVRRAVEEKADVVLIDTAGRLHTKAGLMDELSKIRRVVEKVAPVREVLLVLDATTGQNGAVQAQVFTEAVAVTGVVLTKLDGTAKGGIVVSVQRRLGIPVKLIGLGEGPDDLAPFEPEAFVDALIGEAEPAAS